MAKRPADLKWCIALAAIALALALAACPEMRCLWGCNGDTSGGITAAPGTAVNPDLSPSVRPTGKGGDHLSL